MKYAVPPDLGSHGSAIGSASCAGSSCHVCVVQPIAGLGVILLINIVFSFSVSGISIGGHLGGLVGGLITGAVVVELGERRGARSAALAACAAVGAISFVAAIAVAGSHGLTPHGLTFGG